MKNAATSIKSKINGAAVHIETASDVLGAKLKAARAEARKLRAERDAFAAKLEEAESKAAHDEMADDHYQTEAQRRLYSALDEVLGECEAPSWKRHVAALVTACAVALGCGWLIGYVVGMCMVGAAALTGSLVVVGMIWVIGMIVSMIAGTIAAGKTYSLIASGRIDQVASNAKNKVTGWFKAKPSFTGLFTKGEAA